MNSRPACPIFRRIHRLAGCALAAGIVLAASCERGTAPAPDEPATPDDPVAIEIGEREVRLSELQAEIDFLREKRSPSAANPDAFLAASIERRVALSKALELGLDRDPELRRQWENLLIGRLRETAIETQLRQAAVTDAEIEDYFRRHQNAYSSPARLHLALLFLSVPARADDTARAAVRERMEQARAIALELPDNTRGFGEHAMTYSEEATRRFKGGDIGWLEAGASAYRWPDEVVEAGFALQNTGDISEVIETPGGFYLLKKLDAREPTVRSLDGRLRATLVNALLKE
ncbi:MAG TPA: peptidylprolyl isomerase, partial [Luteolibacter sp.]|nr:peptidylprolyl isomerase [Luteolibacter sp.]